MAAPEVIEIPVVPVLSDSAPAFPLPAHSPLYLDKHVNVPPPPNLLQLYNSPPATTASQNPFKASSLAVSNTDIGAKSPPNVAPSPPASPAQDAEPSASFFDLFRFASSGDKVMVGFAFFLAVLHGACLPAFSYVFGEFMDTTGSVGPNELLDRVSFLASIMVGIGAFAFVASGLWTALFAYSSQKQGARIRTIYLASIIGKDCAW
jgi:hypothetical protein